MRSRRVFKPYSAGRGIARVAVMVGSILASTLAHADPASLRVGIGGAGEEQLWLLHAKPAVAPGQGKDYTLDITRFAGNDKRFQAFEAGALDFITTSANAALLAASEGAKFKVIASLSRESANGFQTTYLVSDSSPIKSIKDLKGKKIGIDALNSSTHLWAKLVLEKNGIDPNRDVTFVPVSFPAQGQALRSGMIDVGVFPQPFASSEETRGGVRPLFTSRDAVPFDQELMLVIASPDVLKNQPAAVHAFLKDLKTATRFYDDHTKDARQALIDAHDVRVTPAVYLSMSDYYRDPTDRVDVQTLAKMQDILIKNGIQRKPVDVNQLVDMSWLPKE
ncbi:ABC transporter substrate-binding protein [Paraburkholderia sp. Ac-20342]|uniref:ABC transporter substrate-binding protein n=1 Tax=Paraburkholderia sp. Ac-20342 TaxID=2703889 RepID=UPI00198248B3|nr:ABC transporter substrate-binding protein [Paraburkholderia sp. Ac-20342]MBN3849493.1 ABC transporter substrate-binding protein [Paraburkholderia sp. Ac-20342]